MRMTTIRDFRSSLATVAEGHETILVTRNGKPAGVFIPWNDDADLPLEIKREAFKGMGNQLANVLNYVDEKEMLDDFKAHRKSRRS